MTGQRARIPRTYAERQRRRRAVEAWVSHYGLACPGWSVPPHTVARLSDLTADHIIRQREGGTNGPLRVLCRACNSRRG